MSSFEVGSKEKLGYWRGKSVDDMSKEELRAMAEEFAAMLHYAEKRAGEQREKLFQTLAPAYKRSVMPPSFPISAVVVPCLCVLFILILSTLR